MNHLLVVPLQQAPKGFLDSVGHAGWRVSTTANVPLAKQMLQQDEVTGVVVELNQSSQDSDRLNMLHFVQEFYPGKLVIVLDPGTNTSPAAGGGVLQALNPADDANFEVTLPALDHFHLSPAQERIARLVAQAFPNREIGRRLHIKEQSVRNELSRIFKKIGLRNRVELAMLMLASGPGGEERKSPSQSEEPGNTEFRPAADEPAPPHISMA